MRLSQSKGRALVLALRRLARAQWSRGYKHLIFLDNLALTFSVAKGRASNHTLLRINQKISALCLAGGLQSESVGSPVN